VGLEQLERQALFVEPGVQQTGQHVGPVRRDAGPIDGAVKHSSDAGDGPLHPYSSRHRGDQVGAADQGRRELLEVGDRSDPLCGADELIGGDRVLPDHRDRCLPRPPAGHGALGPAPKKPRSPRRVVQLPRRAAT
jgi:hypothetical protein